MKRLNYIALIVWQFLIMQSLNIFLYNSFHNAGMGNRMNIAINFAINVVLSLFLTWAFSRTITPLTNYTCNKVSALLWKRTEALRCKTETEITESFQEQTIPYPEKYGNSPALCGASSFCGAANHLQSRYYIANDYFHMKSDATLHILNLVLNLDH